MKTLCQTWPTCLAPAHRRDITQHCARHLQSHRFQQTGMRPCCRHLQFSRTGYLDTEHCIPAVLRRGRGRGRAGRVCKVPSHSGLPRAAVRRASTRVISSTARGQELILITSCAWWIARCVTYLARNIWLSDIRESLDRNLKF